MSNIGMIIIINNHLAILQIGYSGGSSPPMEPNDHDLRIVPDEAKELFNRLSLFEHVEKTLYFDIFDVSFTFVLTAAITAAVIVWATVISLAHRAVPVVHAYIGWGGKATRLLAVHMDHVLISCGVFDRLIVFWVDFESPITMWTANKLVFDVDWELWDLGYLRLGDDHWLVTLVYIIFVIKSRVALVDLH